MPTGSTTGRGSHRTPFPEGRERTHQLGGSLGLGILVIVFAAADYRAVDAAHLFAHRVAVSLTVGTGMLVFAFVLVVTLIVRVRRTADIASHPAVSQAASRT